MSTEWRRKTYYRPRVLISTERILDPQFDDALLCITGPQLEMLRNLTQYLKRRSTFSQSETDIGYLSPSTEDWNSIQAIVADLEEVIMGCEEFTALFEAMLVQLQCICNKASVPTTDLGTVQPIVEIGLGNGDFIENDPYAPDTEIEARRCAVAQLTFWQSWGWLTEVIQPIQENAMDALVPIFLGVVTAMLGATPFAIPAGAAIALISLLIDVWYEGNLVDVQNALWAHRDELTCAVYMGLAYDYRQAESNATDEIEDVIEWSAMDKVLIRAMYAPWAIKLASVAFTQDTDWAQANVAAGTCDDCDWIYQAEYHFPPSPGDWAGGFPSYSGRWPGLNQSEEGTSVEFELPSIVANVDIETEIQYMSSHGYGNTVGYCVIEYQDVATDWHSVGGVTCTTLVAAGAITTTTGTDVDKSVPRNVLRVNIHGQPGQAETNPWPFMPSYIKIKIYPHV